MADNGKLESPNAKADFDSQALLTYEQIVEQIQEKLQNLLTFDDFTSANATADLRFIQNQTRYSSDVVLNRRIVERIVRCGVSHVYLRAWHSLSTADYFSDTTAFTNLQLVLSIIWNCSDKSVSLCDCLARAAVANHMLAELAASQLLDANLTDDPDRHYLVKAYLGILHNMVRMCADSRQVFRSADAVTVLQQYLQRPQGLVRTKSYLILSYVVDERENDIINATDENIAYIVHILQTAVDSENHFSQMHAFWASEIACGLNHLAINDGNKQRLGNLGAIDLYVRLLRDGSTEERSLAAAGLWILSFNAHNRQHMLDSPDCLQVLQEATLGNSDEGVCRAARGALWVIKATAGKSPVKKSDADIPHVMISYHWGSQRTMLVVRDKLKDAGYKVWMDIDNMTGSTLEAMALAVERSAVVLVCLSQGYKDSPSCRTEAEYMYRLRKQIIPLVLEPGYVPDGWLGILIGTKLFFDLSQLATFDAELERVIQEIGNRGRRPAAGPLVSTPTTSSSCLRCAENRQTVNHTYKTLSPPTTLIASWTQVDVQTWLTSVNLTHCADRFREFDGAMLLQFKKMMQTAPQYFYHCLEDQFGLKVVEVLNFSRGLESLQ